MKKWSRFEKAVLAVTVLFVLTAGVCFAVRQRPANRWRVETQHSGQPGLSRPQDGEQSRPDSLLEGETININTAPAADLERLPGIGAVRAQAIVAFREANGPFSTVDGLTGVDGIGSGIVEQLRPYASVG